MPRPSEPEIDACSGHPNRKWTHAPAIRIGNGRMPRPSEPEIDACSGPIACSGHPNPKWTHAPAIRTGNRRMLRSSESPHPNQIDACSGHPNRKWTHAPAIRTGNRRMLRPSEQEMDACSGHPNRELTHAPAVRNGHRRIPRSSEPGIHACFEGPTGRTGRLAGGATSTCQAYAERGTIREKGYTPPRACGPLCRSEDRRSRARVPWGLRAMRGPRCRSGRMPRSSEPEMDACPGHPIQE